MRRMNIEQIVRRLAPKPPAGYRLDFEVFISDVSDAYVINGSAHRDGALGEELRRTYRRASITTNDIGKLARVSDSAVLEEFVRCVRLVVAYLFPARPAFRIGTKNHAKRLRLERS